ncbi:hypothetical protein DL93DRAFT_2132573 [Clavulina sp. PMI_390]|nr:hypothetical protein DL93DRAFT_2132573 [Clavulina sp. PMI_390]
MVFTGELLERVSTWTAMQELDELLILIPMLNNMKGNLEMNLSARLSTAANTGSLDTIASRRTQVLGTLSLLQVQALCLSILAGIGSFSLGKLLQATAVPEEAKRAWRPRSRLSVRGPTRPSKFPTSSKPIGFREYLAVTAVALASASLSSIMLGSFMCSVIMWCRRYRLNPDNVATPLASCLGDLVTLTLLSFIATALTLPSLLSIRFPLILTIALVGLLVWMIVVSLRNPVSRPLLKDLLGWLPLLCAMVVSSGTGLVLDRFVTKWREFGDLGVVISGLPPSLGAVFISRLSTQLHAEAEESTERSSADHKEINKQNMASAAILFCVGIPIVIVYLLFMHLTGWIGLRFLFYPLFMVAFAAASVISLWMANLLTRQFWARGLDPDTYCLPVHTAVMELVGQSLLVSAYLIASGLGVDVRIHDPVL